MVRNREGVAITCNASAERILGVPAESLLGHPPRGCGCELLNADGAHCPRGEEPSMITLRTGRPCSDVILGVRRPDAEVRWIQVNTSPIFGEDPAAPEAVVVSYLDVTERHRSAAALRESEANYRNLFEQMPEGCAVHESAGTGETAAYRFLAVNPGLRTAHRPARGDAVNGPQPPRRAAAHGTRVGGCLRACRALRRAGPLRALFPGARQTFRSHRLASRRAAFRDDPRRRHRTARDGRAPRESEARYRHMVETAWEGVWQIDAEHRTTFVNRRMADMLGYTREELAGRPVTDFVDGAAAGMALAALGAFAPDTPHPWTADFAARTAPSFGSCSRLCPATMRPAATPAPSPWWRISPSAGRPSANSSSNAPSSSPSSTPLKIPSTFPIRARMRSCSSTVPCARRSAATP